MRAGIRMDQKTKSNPRARGFIRIRKKDSPENLIKSTQQMHWTGSGWRYKLFDGLGPSLDALEL